MSASSFPDALGPLPSLRAVNPHQYGLGAWSDHIPFAFDLMAELRPALLVELGTFSGESYFAFCQAVAENGTRTVCHAVDTWRGDEHAGDLDESAFLAVTAHNRQFYAPFSRLIRAAFDEAHARFADGSIDLLHIDGLHTYDAVRHDFDSWLPKLSDRGIVLLHDVAARHDDFGVWKLWEEIAAPGRSFFFTHGWGLGVWRKDPATPLPSRFLEQLFAAGPAEVAAIREYYERAAAELRERQRTTQEAAILCQLFFPRREIPEDGQVLYSEQHSFCVRYAPNVWHRLVLPLPVDYDGAPLRLDPLDCVGLLELGDLAIFARHFSGKPLWTCRGLAQLSELQIAGRAQRVPDPCVFRMLSMGNDPHLLLPAVTLPAQREGENNQPLQLEILLRAHTSPTDLLASFEDSLATCRETTDKLQQALDVESAAARIAASETRAIKAELTSNRTERLLAATELNCARTELAQQTNGKALLESSRREIIDDDRLRVEKLRSLEKVLADERATATSLSAQFAESEPTRQRLEETVRHQEAELQVVREATAQQAAQILALSESFQKLEADYRTELGRRRSMQRAFTWRLGLPLRALGRLLTSGSFQPKKKRIEQPAAQS